MTSRDRRLRKKYGITQADYVKILGLQGGGCAVCGRTKQPKQRHLHVDHDHRTKKVRGILCWQHNAGLRKFRDNPAWLDNAANYLLFPPAGFLYAESADTASARRRRSPGNKPTKSVRASAP